MSSDLCVAAADAPAAELVSTSAPHPNNQLEPLVLTDAPDDLFVFAKQPAEMAEAQAKLLAWAERKLADQRQDHADLCENFAIATKNKWRSDVLKRHAAKALKKVKFYEKLRDAIAAGYCIVPAMDIEVFAIRTTRKRPKQNWRISEYSVPIVPVQESNVSASGEGEFVSSEVAVKVRISQSENAKGQPVTVRTSWADAFLEVDFPFVLAKPQVLEATAQAIQEKIFDAIGILPNRGRGDPMVIGRIEYKHGYQSKRVDFVIAWFIDTREL